MCVCHTRCVKYLRLFTNKGQKVAVGRIEPGSAGQARNVTKNRDNGLLVAVKGWQDPPKPYGERAWCGGAMGRGWGQDCLSAVCLHAGVCLLALLHLLFGVKCRQ